MHKRDHEIGTLVQWLKLLIRPPGTTVPDGLIIPVSTLPYLRQYSLLQSLIYSPQTCTLSCRHSSSASPRTSPVWWCMPRGSHVENTPAINEAIVFNYLRFSFIKPHKSDCFWAIPIMCNKTGTQQWYLVTCNRTEIQNATWNQQKISRMHTWRTRRKGLTLCHVDPRMSIITENPCLFTSSLQQEYHYTNSYWWWGEFI